LYTIIALYTRGIYTVSIVIWSVIKSELNWFVV
jgi:hypothetical protein